MLHPVTNDHLVLECIINVVTVHYKRSYLLIDMAGCVMLQVAGKERSTGTADGAPAGQVPAPPGQPNPDDNEKEANLCCLCLTVVSLWQAHFCIFTLHLLFRACSISSAVFEAVSLLYF